MKHVLMEELSPLAREIVRKGIHFATAKAPEFIPIEVRPSGYRIYQNPEQLASLVKLLIEENVTSYCEIGIKFGGTFRFICEKLKKTVGLDRAVGIDIIDMSDIEEIISEQGLNAIFIRERSKNVFLENSYDAIFIDGDHSYEGVSLDFERFKNKATKLVIFHDIVNPACSGVVKLWSKLKNKYRSKEFVQYGNYGIGVLYIKEEKNG